MKLFNKFLLSLSLLPLILILLISSINLNKKSSLKIFLWNTPQINLGAYLTFGVGLGFFTSFILLQSATMNQPKLRTKRIINTVSNYQNNKDDQTTDQTTDETIKEQYVNYNEVNTTQSYIERDPREPSPTISIPYRILKKKNRKPDYIAQQESYELEEQSAKYNDYKKSNYNQNINQEGDWYIKDYENW
tara:strand:+ start:177 stop:746 length:570 start_codon:yes stop_codon:yes gene_type:complete